VNVDAIEKGWMVLDIGPETAKVYRDVIKNYKLIVWNGPMGVFEIEAFSKGTKAVAEALRDTKGYTINGGSDSTEAIEKYGLADSMDQIANGGGAAIEDIEEKKLKGIEDLKQNKEGD